MKRIALAALLIGVIVAPAHAQGRGRNRQGIPPGHLPAAGECRVWYDGVPPGQQPRPTSCREAERVASRDRDARVIYGSAATRGDRGDSRDRARDDDWQTRGDERRRRDGGATSGRDRAVPRRDTGPDGYPYPEARSPRRGGIGANAPVAVRNGYQDGLVKGREDIGDGDRFDPARHSWYRSGDRGYNSRYGSREEYRSDYREGFLAGYEEAYDGRAASRPRTGGRDWWPF